MKITGAEALMKSLQDAGVTTIFGYPGGAIMPVYDALYHYGKQIRHILVRHEQGAAHAAEGYARASGNPGVCMVTSGPGATNLVTGIADAMMDSVPIVCITGQVAAPLLGSDAFQETDIIGITTPITKWNYQITKAQELPSTIAKAFAIATSGRPGPVVIDITKNAQIEIVDYKKASANGALKRHQVPKPTSYHVQQAARLINNAKRPFILAGHGVRIAKAESELGRMAEKGDIPVATTLHGLSCLPSQHRLFVGMLGMHGNFGPNVLTNSADVIIAVGTRFDDRVTGKLTDYAKQAKIIHIEIDEAEMNKNVKADVAIHANAKDALFTLIPHIKKRNRSDWLSQFQKHYRIEYEKVIKHEIAPTGNQLRMAEVIYLLSQKARGEAIVVSDVGQHQMVTARYFRFNRPNSFITSGGLGTMGFALPAAVGAKIAQPEREVIAIIGDGSFQMTMQELATIAQEDLVIKIVILNNSYLGMVRQWQELFFENRYSFVDLKNPDFVQVTKGFGIPASKVEKRSELDQALDRLVKAKTSYLLEAVVEKEANVFPMVPSGASVTQVRLE